MGKALALTAEKSIFAAASAPGDDKSFDPVFDHCCGNIQRMNKWRLEPYQLALPSTVPFFPSDAKQMAPPRIDYGGEDLATVLFYLSEVDPGSLQKIGDKLREMEPAFMEFEFNFVGANKTGFSCVFSDSRGSVSAARLSSGTLTFLGLVTLTSLPNRPALMMIEEPENGLTPKAAQSFYKAIHDLAHADQGGTQVILSSHSPYVICDAWNGEDRSFIYQVSIQDGRSQIRSFDSIIQDQDIQLRKEKVRDEQSGKTVSIRQGLGLNQAESIMNGFYGNSPT